MKLLLDTHALLWWLEGNARLSRRVRSLVADETNDVAVSAASAWEIATKSRLGKLPGALVIAHRLADVIARQGFTSLPVTVEDAQSAGWLASEHRDPFDRMIAVQAQRRGLAVATDDHAFVALGVTTVW